MHVQGTTSLLTRAAMTVAAAVTLSTVTLTNPPSAAAADCPDIEVVFARGTDEPPASASSGKPWWIPSNRWSRGSPSGPTP